MKSQNIDPICNSILFISPQFNSTKNSKTIFHQNSIQKIIQNYLFPTNSIQNSIQNFEIGWIQFNKIFIQFENVGIDQGLAFCHLPKRLILEFWNGVWFLQTFETVKRLGS